MTRVRVAAALAVMLTAFLLQATIVGPVTVPVPVSLPAVVVALVALADGPGTGLALGFGAGLVADLASGHPAGILALAWLGVGLICGCCAVPGASLRRDAAVAAVVAGVIGTLAAAVIVVLGHGSALSALVRVVPTVPGDALLALALAWPVRRMLRAEALRAPRPILLIGGRG